MSFHHVLLLPHSDLTTLPVAELGDALAPIFDQHPLDMRQRLRYCGGWLAEWVQAPLAQQVEALCVELDLPVARVDAVEREAIDVVHAREAYFDGHTLSFEHPKKPATLALSQIAAVDLVPIPEDQKSRATSPWAGIPAQQGFPFDPQRAFLLEHHLEPVLHVLRHPPFGIYRVSRGTLLPDYADVMGGLWLDNLLTFLHHLVITLGESRVTPETVNFWSHFNDDSTRATPSGARPLHDTRLGANSPANLPDPPSDLAKSADLAHSQRLRDDDAANASHGMTTTGSAWIKKEEELLRRLGWQRELFENGLWGNSDSPGQDTHARPDPDT